MVCDPVGSTNAFRHDLHVFGKYFVVDVVFVVFHLWGRGAKRGRKMLDKGRVKEDQDKQSIVAK